MAEQKKYKLRTESRKVGPYTTYLIEALVDIPSMKVSVGDLGGWISSEENLSHEGTCWVSDNAVVVQDAIISEDAHIKKNAFIAERARISGNSVISGSAQIGGDANINNSRISTHVVIKGSVVIIESRIGGKTKISGNVEIFKSGIVTDGGLITHDVNITNSKVYGTNIHISNHARILTSTVGTSIETNRGLRIHEMAVIEKAVINSDKQVEIGGKAQILEHASVNGKDILINGLVVVRGYARIRSHSSLRELAVVDGGDVKPTSMDYYDLENAVISGDTHVILSKTS